jgi:hypothetical protein
LFGWLTWFGYTSNVIGRPVVLVLIYSVLGRFAGSPEAGRSYALGIASFTMAMNILPGIAQCYTYDRTGGTLSFFFASPANRLESYLARAVLHYPNGLLSFASTVVAAWLVVGIDFGSVSQIEQKVKLPPSRRGIRDPPLASYRLPSRQHRSHLSCSQRTSGKPFV